MDTFKEAMKYSALLIAGYLAVAYGTAWGVLITEASKGSVTLIKALQGQKLP